MNNFSKKVRILSFIFLLVATSFLLFACTKTYKVTFDFNGGVWNSKTREELTIKKGEVIPVADIPTPTKDNFDFEGWLQGTDVVNLAEFKVTKNETFTAKWKTKEVTEEKYQVIIDQQLTKYFKFDNGFLVGEKVSKGTKVTFTLQNISPTEKVKEVTQNGTKLEPNNGKYEITLNSDVTLSLIIDKAEYGVTVKDPYKNYIEFENYTVGQKLFKGDKVVFKAISIPEDKHLSKVLQNNNELTIGSDNKYEVVVMDNIEISLLLEDKYKLTVKEDSTGFVIFQNYVVNTFVISGTEVKFKVNLNNPDFELLYVLKGTEKINPDSEGVYTVVLDNNYEISVEYKLIDRELEEVNVELNKFKAELVNNLLKVQEDNHLTVKAKVESFVDTGVVVVEVEPTSEPQEYKVTLKHIANEDKKLSHIFKVTVVQHYSITLPSEVTAQAGINIASVQENTEVVLTVNVPTDKTLTSFLVNGEEKIAELVSNKYTFNINANTTVSVEFGISDEYKALIKAELDKVNTISLIAPTGVINLEDVREKVNALVNTLLVATEVRVDGGTYYLKVTSIKYNEVSYEKAINVEIEKATIRIHFGEHANYNGNSTFTLVVNKNSFLLESQLPSRTDITITDPSYAFVGYSKEANGSPINFGANGINIADDLELYAVVLMNVVPVRFVAENILDSDSFNKLSVVTKGDKVVSLGNPVRPGYKFKFWALSTSLNQEYDFENAVNSEIELHAIFEDNTYLKYELLPSDEYTLSGLADTTVTEIYVPETFNGKKIVSVKHRAFHSNRDLVKFVVIGEISEIGTWSFFDSNLKVLELGNHVKVIGESAFEKTNITSVVLPATVEYIGAYAFAECSYLTDVEFKNKNFKAISYIQFNKSKYLNNLLASTTNALVIINDVLITATTDLSNSAVIPASVTHIGEGAFNVDGISLKEVSFENGSKLTHIGNYAFQRKQLPEDFVIPMSVKHIGFRAFFKATGVKKISYEAGSALESVRPEAFAQIMSLITYELPTGFSAISKKQFYFSKNLVEINNTDSLTYIGEDALFGTEWFKQNRIDEYGSVKKFITFKDKILLLDVKSTNADEIPATVEYISPGAFYRTERTTLTLPKTIKEIYPGAFHGNGALTTLHISGYINKIHKHAFDFQSEFAGAIPKTTVIIDDFDTKPENWDENWNIVREYSYNQNDRIEFLWSPICTVNFDLNGGSSATPIVSQTTTNGGTITIPNVEITYDGKVFVGWELDGVRFTSTTNVTKTITVTAKYVDVNPDYDFKYENETIVILKFKNDTLTSFEIPNQIEGVNVTVIDSEAFINKANLAELKLPVELTTIKESAFAGCAALETIDYTNSIKLANFGKDVFKGTKFISNLHSASNTLIINKVLVDAKAARDEHTFVNVEKIVGYAFAENTTVTKAIFQEGLTHVESFAFAGATALVDIVLPKGASYVKANAFAIGGSNTVNIDCTAVSYVAPLTWEAGYDNGNGATLNFIWEHATTHSVTLPAEVTCVDPTVNTSVIKEGTTIQLQIATKEYHELTEFNVNGVNKLAEVMDNKYNLLVDQNIVITVKYDLENVYKNQFDEQFNKLKDVMGFYNQREHEIDGIRDTVNQIVDTNVVTCEVESNASNYNITLSYNLVPSFTRTKENVEFKSVGKLNSNNITVRNYSAQVHGGEAATCLFDKFHTSKWCDNSGIAEKYVLAELNETTFVSRFAITHAGIKESTSFNTGKFKILVGTTMSDLHEVVYVENNTDTRTYHTIAGEEIKFIKLVVLHGENMDGGHVARVYELELFGVDANAFDVTLDYNGGNYKGDITSKVRMSIDTGIFEKDLLPLTREVYSFVGYKKPGESGYFDFGTRLSGALTLIAHWQIAPEVGEKIDAEFVKIKNIEFVITDETTLTNELVKAHIEKIVNLGVVDVKAEKIDETTFKITLCIKGRPELYKENTFTFYPKKEGETVNVTFDLNGGQYNSSIDNVVKQIEKGTKMIPEQVITVLRTNYKFVGWQYEGVVVDVTDHLLVQDVVFVAKWEISDEIRDAVDQELNKIHLEEGVIVSHDEFNDNKRLEHLKSLVDEAVVTLEIEHVSDYRYVVKLKSVAEINYSKSKEIEIYRLVPAELPECMFISNAVKPGYLAIGSYNTIETRVSEGITVTIKSSVGITNIDEYLQDADFTPEIELEAVNVKIEVEFVIDNDRVNKELDKLVDELIASYSIDDPDSVTEQEMLKIVLKNNETYGMVTTISSLGNRVFELTFTCVADSSLFRKRKVIVTGPTHLKSEPQKPSNYWLGWNCSDEVDGHGYMDFFSRTLTGEVDTNTYWAASQYDSDNASYISIQMPQSLTRSKFNLKIYHGGVIGLDNNTDFNIHFGIGNAYLAKYKNRWNLVKEFRNNTENITEFEFDATTINSWFYIVIEITKGSINDNHAGLLVGMDIFAKKRLPQIKINLDGGNIAGDTGNIVAPIIDKKIADGFMPTVPTKAGKKFVGWKIKGSVIDHDALANVLFEEDELVITAVWEDE